MIHSRKERRYQCKRCRRTFSARRDTALYRMHKPEWLVLAVVTLLAYGCPLQAIVAAFDLDERTVARWQREAGLHCKRLHEHLVEAGRVRLLQVQADEIRVRAVGGVLWLASAIVVSSRLWLGGVVSPTRDARLIRSLLERVWACGTKRALLLCTDGLLSYPKQALRVFRLPERTGRSGHPRMLLPAGLLIAQMVKRYAQRRVVEVERRVVHGTEAAVAAILCATQGAATAVINTAYIERLNATFRAHLAPLTRRGRAIARTEAALTAGMWLVGTAYNFCWPHDSLRRLAPDQAPRKWLPCTPAMAAGLAEQPWTLDHLLRFQIPLPRWVPTKRPGRPPKRPPLKAAA